MRPDTITDEARARAAINSATVVGVSVLYFILVTVFTGTRVYTRFRVYQQFWWDDCKWLLSLYRTSLHYVSRGR